MKLSITTMTALFALCAAVTAIVGWFILPLSLAYHQSQWQQLTLEGQRASLQDRPEDAERFHRLALEEAEQIAPTDTRFAQSAELLAEALRGLKRFDEAQQLFNAASSVYEQKCIGTRSGASERREAELGLSACLNGLANLYEDQGKTEDAVSVCRQALSLYNSLTEDRTLPGNNMAAAEQMVHTYCVLAEEAFSGKHYDESHFLYTKAIALCSKVTVPSALWQRVDNGFARLLKTTNRQRDPLYEQLINAVPNTSETVPSIVTKEVISADTLITPIAARLPSRYVPPTQSDNPTESGTPSLVSGSDGASGGEKSTVYRDEAKLELNQGHLSAAEKLFWQAYSRSLEEKKERRQRDLLEDLTELYRRQDRYVDAQQTYNKLSSLTGEWIRQMQPEAALERDWTKLIESGRSALSNKQYDVAQTKLEKALPIAQQIRPDGPHVARTEIELARLLRARNDYTRAAQLWDAANKSIMSKPEAWDRAEVESLTREFSARH